MPRNYLALKNSRILITIRKTKVAIQHYNIMIFIFTCMRGLSLIFVKIEFEPHYC